MITFTSAAKSALLQPGARPSFKFEIEWDGVNFKRLGGQSLDLTPLVKSFPSLRISLRPTERVPELSGMTVRVENHNGKLDLWKSSGTWLHNGTWHRARGTVKMGVQMGQTEELAIMFVGELDDDIMDIDDKSVELSFVDPFAKLKSKNFGSAAGVYDNEVPSRAVKLMLTSAGFGADLDNTTFDAAILAERLAGLELYRYTPSPSQEEKVSWWDAIQYMLGHVNAGLYWNSQGKIAIFKIAPATSTPVFVLTRNKYVKKCRIDKPGGSILNHYNLFIDDGTGTFVNHLRNLPNNLLEVKDDTSIPIFGDLSEAKYYSWTYDLTGGSTKAALMAKILLDATAFGPTVVDVTTTLDAFMVELWDYVQVKDDVIGLDVKGFVFEKQLNYENAECRFRVFVMPLSTATPDNSKDWLYTENSQKYDDQVPIYGLQL